MTEEAIVAVVGMPRSGTSMMMGMLAAGGLGVACDRECYGNSWETERMLGLPISTAWLDECRGRAVKILEPLQFTPPRIGYRYRFIWMTRDPHQQARSQVKMLRAADVRVVVDLPRHRASLRQDEVRALELLRSYDGDLEVVAFEQVLGDPHGTALRLARHLDLSLCVEAMASVVMARDPQANRRPLKLDHLRRRGA